MSRGNGRGPLILVALMFASSGALRLGDGLGASLARAAEGVTVSDHAASNEVAAHGDAAGPKPTGGDAVCKEPPAALAAALLDREQRLLANEAALADRSAALDLADQAIRGRLEELKQAEESLRATLAIADVAAEEDLARLTAVYETMKPKDAAALFEAMDADFAAGFLGRMRADAAAAVMAGMQPEKAYEVSAILAGRNALAPKE